MAIKCIEPKYAELCFNSINDSTGHLPLIPNFLSFLSYLTFLKTSFRYKFGGETFPNSKFDTFFLLQLQANSLSSSSPIVLRFTLLNGRFVVCSVSSPMVFFVNTDNSNGLKSL